MTVKRRLIRFAKSQEKSVRAFEMKCGLTIGYINAIRVSISPDKIQNIASHYPNLNISWLLTGEGEMTISNDVVGEPDEYGNTKEDILWKLIMMKDKEIALLNKRIGALESEPNLQNNKLY